MSVFDMHDWNWTEYSESALGDGGPWAWWLPLAWRAVADPRGDHLVPPAPEPLREGDHPSDHPYVLAWWAPLLHLLFFGTGWARPDLGLARWIELGQPQEDPVLQVVKRWWGPHVLDLLAWSSCSDRLIGMAAKIADATHTAVNHVPLTDRWAERRTAPNWRSIWECGGPDQMHLYSHALTPVQSHRHTRDEVLIAPGSHVGDTRRAVLMLPSYEGWYLTLSRLGATLPVREDGHSWRVDVVVSPLGWLGSYRRSRLTGRWFSGRHRWHQLGIEALPGE
jgi:hypothetical protein